MIASLRVGSPGRSHGGVGEHAKHFGLANQVFDHMLEQASCELKRVRVCITDAVTDNQNSVNSSALVLFKMKHDYSASGFADRGTINHKQN